MEQAQSKESLNKDIHCNHDCTFLVSESKKKLLPCNKQTLVHHHYVQPNINIWYYLIDFLYTVSAKYYTFNNSKNIS